LRFDTMMPSKRMNVHEALSCLEDLCQSEETGEGPGSSIFSASVCIQPPDDEQGESDKDSGDDEAPEFSNLGRHQLLAAATLEIQDETGRRIIGDTSSNKVEEAAQIKSRKRRRMTNSSSCARWRHKDMNRSTAGDWNIAPPALDTEKSPCGLFEDFFTAELFEFICLETVRYAHSKGKHNFELSVDELKAFMAILLLSGYVVLPRRSMYWERSDDTHNSVASSLMSRNRFDLIMQNLHLADNANLDQTDKFAKVRKLIDYMNDSCLNNFLPEQTISIDKSMIPYFGRH